MWMRILVPAVTSKMMTSKQVLMIGPTNTIMFNEIYTRIYDWVFHSPGITDTTLEYRGKSVNYFGPVPPPPGGSKEIKSTKKTSASHPKLNMGKQIKLKRRRTLEVSSEW